MPKTLFIRAEWDDDANGYPDGPDVPFELLARKFAVDHREAA